ncbi:MAG: AmmeMemoRadiSam system protein B [Calditrichia bacterium]
MKTVFRKEVLGMILLFSAFLSAQTAKGVREPAVAGMFYPGDPDRLTKMIDGFLQNAEPIIEGSIGGLVSPHAGYQYSGPVAGWSYRQIQGKAYDIVVVIAPSHFEYFSGASVYSGEKYLTPLGEIPVATELARKISESSPSIRLSMDGHRVGFGSRGEHSLEVQLPFLQRVLDKFELIPIVIADQSWENVKALGEALAENLKGKKALIVASSDLSHYHSYSTAYELDKKLLKLFEAFDYQKLVESCESRKLEACGYGPIATMMYACSLLGFDKSRVIKYATSGDVPVGEKSQVVGYLSGAVYR